VEKKVVDHEASLTKISGNTSH